jgi:hypothetical protein
LNLHQFLLGHELGLSNSSVGARIVKAINEGFLIESVRKSQGRELKRTEDFFINLVKDFTKEKSDFSNYGIRT